MAGLHAQQTRQHLGTLSTSAKNTKENECEDASEDAPTCSDRMNFLCEPLCAARDKTFEVTSNRLMMSAEVTSGEVKKSGFTSTTLRHLR